MKTYTKLFIAAWGCLYILAMFTSIFIIPIPKEAAITFLIIAVLQYVMGVMVIKIAMSEKELKRFNDILNK